MMLTRETYFSHVVEHGRMRTLRLRLAWLGRCLDCSPTYRIRYSQLDDAQIGNEAGG